MNEQIKIGEINSLKINRASEPGLYLISGDETEVLLPNVYIKKDMVLNQILDVFIYTDSEDRPVATTLVPKAKKNEFAFLEVVDIAKFGAFVDMGLPKDLLVPKNRQKTRYNVGDKKFLRVVEDERSHRLIGDEKVSTYLSKDIKPYKRNDFVEIWVYSKTPLGFKVIVDDKYDGLIYHTEIFEPVNIGDKKTAFIKNVRDDKKLDISLQKIGDVKADDIQKVIDVLSMHKNGLGVTSKSDADEIMEYFSMSKKRFKSALNSLLSDDKITQIDNFISLKS